MFWLVVAGGVDGVFSEDLTCAEAEDDGVVVVDQDDDGVFGVWPSDA